MTHGRRTIDRRRRVLYTAHHANTSAGGAARRRTTERLREAKRPAAAYGARVHRRLQGRWFSLVPVRQCTLLAVAGSLLLLAALLTAAHYAAVAWPPVASRPGLARPLRLDRPDSFGRWAHAVVWAAAAGASLMIYQLRRYRLDDYLGHYRIWRVVLLAAIAASVNSVASLVDWSGAILDAVFGRRVALSGQDWIRLVLTLGGAVLALRITAEVRRSRAAIATMVVAWILLAIPVAATWNLLAVDGIGSWMLVTSTPLFASTTLLVSLGCYLRQLYREVRQIEAGDPMWQRVRQLGLQLVRPDREEPGDLQADAPETEDAPEKRARRRWFDLRPFKAVAPDDSNPNDAETDTVGSGAATDKRATSASQPPTSSSETKSSRRRFALRWRRKPRQADSEEDDNPVETAAADEEAATDDGGDSPSTRRRRFRFSLPRPTRWLRRRSQNDRPGEAEDEPASHPHDASPADSSPTSDESASDQDEAWIDPDEIDWSSLSKTQRRRLRKQLRRQERAA